MPVSFLLRPYHPDDFETLWQIDQRCFLPGIAYSKHELASFLRQRGAVCIVAETSTGVNRSPASQTTESPTESLTELPTESPTESALEAPTESPLNFRILGFVIVLVNPRQAAAYITTLDVLSRMRRLGAGTALMAAAEQLARDGACTAVHLEAAVENESALAFYARQGYGIVSTVADYYAPGAHAYSLTKPLT